MTRPSSFLRRGLLALAAALPPAAFGARVTRELPAPRQRVQPAGVVAE